MDLNHIQTELVACALCEADGRNPDSDVPSGNRAGPLKAWQTYESEARSFIGAARALGRWSQTLNLFRSLAPLDQALAPELQAS